MQSVLIKHCKPNEFLDSSGCLAFISVRFMFVLWFIFFIYLFILYRQLYSLLHTTGYTPVKTTSGCGFWPKLNNTVLLAKLWAYRRLSHKPVKCTNRRGPALLGPEESLRLTLGQGYAVQVTTNIIRPIL